MLVVLRSGFAFYTFVFLRRPFQCFARFRCLCRRAFGRFAGCTFFAFPRFPYFSLTLRFAGNRAFALVPRIFFKFLDSASEARQHGVVAEPIREVASTTPARRPRCSSHAHRWPRPRGTRLRVDAGPARSGCTDEQSDG